MSHMIQLADDVHPQRDDYVYAEKYEIQQGWLMIVKSDTGETRLYPPEAVREVVVDDAMFEQ